MYKYKTDNMSQSSSRAEFSVINDMFYRVYLVRSRGHAKLITV